VGGEINKFAVEDVVRRPTLERLAVKKEAEIRV